MPAEIDVDKCTGCGVCVDACPVEAITVNDTASVDADTCVDCGSCVEECPNDAITLN